MADCVCGSLSVTTNCVCLCAVCVTANCGCQLSSMKQIFHFIGRSSEVDTKVCPCPWQRSQLTSVPANATSSFWVSQLLAQIILM